MRTQFALIKKNFRLDINVVTNFKHMLKRVHLEFNQIAQLNADFFDGMLRLESVDLSHNRISALSNMIFGSASGAATRLREVNLAGNRIEEILHPGTFLYVSSLTVLNLSFNRLRKNERGSVDEADESSIAQP